MKTYNPTLILICFSLFFTACSKADDERELQQEYLFAEIDGEHFAVDDLNGQIVCRKLLSSYGTINLSLKVERSDGKVMEFLILNYTGSKKYLVGNPDLLNDGNGNFNWMNYEEILAGEFWSTQYKRNFNFELPDFIEITHDSGRHIEGSFSFIGHRSDGTSFRTISNGIFNLELDH